MCKYCKHLKELSKQREKFMYDSVQAWRRHVICGDKLMEELILLLQSAVFTNILLEQYVPIDHISKVIERAREWVHTDVIIK